MACCAGDGENLIDNEISDETRRKKSSAAHTVSDESTPLLKPLTEQKCTAPTTTSATTTTTKDTTLLTISDGELETLLQEASNPLYLKSSNNPLLQKVIDETNFDEPYLGPGNALGKFPPIYKESRRHLERRMRQDAASCMASACTTQGGSLQNLSPAKHADSSKSKALRKSGSLNTFPAGSDDTRELAALKSLLAASVAHKPSTSRTCSSSSSSSSKPTSIIARGQRILASQVLSYTSFEDHQPLGGDHRRNRSLSECPVTLETEEEPVQLRRKCSADTALELEPGVVRTEEQQQQQQHKYPLPPPAEILLVDQLTDAIEEIEMMDIDHSSEDAKGETLPLLVKDTENVPWSSSCVQRAFVEVSAPQKVCQEADDKVSFPLTLTRASDVQSNGQIYVDTGAYRPLLANKGFHNKLIFPMAERRSAVSGLLESMSADAAVARHSGLAALEADIQQAASRASDDEFKSSSYQRSLDENGNPFNPHDGGGGGMYRNAATFLHHDPDSNRSGARKQKKARQSSKQREMLAEQIEGHFGSLDIEVIMKRIMDSEVVDDGGGGGGEDRTGASTTRTTKRTLNKESGGGGGGNNVSKNLKTKKFAGNANNKRNLFENGLGNSKDDQDSSPSPVDSDDHPERSSTTTGVREKSSKLRKQEFQKKGGGGSGTSSNENGVAGSAAGNRSTSNSVAASLDGEAGNRGTKSPEPSDAPRSTGGLRSDKPTAVKPATQRDVCVVVQDGATNTKESGNELSSFVNDFYATGTLVAADEPEFHEVRKKKKRRQRSSLQASNKGSGSGRSGSGGQFYSAAASMDINSSHSDGDQGGGGSIGGGEGCGSDFSRRNQNPVSNSSDGSSCRTGEVMLWPDLPHHRGNPFSADDVRRKSMGSVPPSEHSSGGDSDIESVHSLPVSGTTPKTSVGKTSSSSSCTPQASYADITKMSGGNTNPPRRTLSLSSSSSSASHPATTSTAKMSVDAKRDAATCTSADLCVDDCSGSKEDWDAELSDPAAGHSAEQSNNEKPPPNTSNPVVAKNCDSSGADGQQELTLVDTTSTTVIAASDSSEVNVKAPHPSPPPPPHSSNPLPSVKSNYTTCDKVAALASHAPPKTTVTAAGTPPPPINITTTTTTTSSAASSSSSSSRTSKAGHSTSRTASNLPKNRPVVVFAGDLISPHELSEVKFGFDINEQLLKESEFGRRQQVRDKVQVPSVASAVVPVVTETDSIALQSIVGSVTDSSGIHFTTCGEDDDSIVAAGRVTGTVLHDDPHGDGGGQNVDIGTASAVHSQTLEEADDEDMRAFNYQSVVDFIGAAWKGVRRELDREAEKSGNRFDHRPQKIHYLKRPPSPQ